jgi:F0F1-type ATP synthase membrane subunit b/b'
MGREPLLYSKLPRPALEILNERRARIKSALLDSRRNGFDERRLKVDLAKINQQLKQLNEV